jgi:hypothetical protein
LPALARAAIAIAFGRQRFISTIEILATVASKDSGKSASAYAPMTVKGIPESPRQGGDFLTDFIVRTRDKDLRHCDLSTALSARAERLLSLRP